MTQDHSRPVQVFISYSRKDEMLLDELKEHLSPLRREGMIELWHDRQIHVGDSWKDVIDEKLESADVILFLVSVDFLASEYLYDIEMKRALERHERRESRVIPIVLRPCVWEASPLGRFQALPRNAQPVITWVNRDEAWSNVVQGIRAAVRGLRDTAAPVSVQAQEKIITLLLRVLSSLDSLEKMATAWEQLKPLPSEVDYLWPGLSEARRRVTAISVQAQDYLTRETPAGRLKILEELRRELEYFRDAMTLTEPPVGPGLAPIALRWLEIVSRAEAESRKQMAFTPIPNPFKVGNPLQQSDNELFKGRTDIIVAIEENIANASRPPALLLYGRRRTGKSSTLLNLPRLLSSQFIPVYMDCQNAKWRDGDDAFCYHLANAAFNEMRQRNLDQGLSAPRLEDFAKYAFTKLDEFLDDLESLSQEINKRILLCFDEYERLEGGAKPQRSRMRFSINRGISCSIVSESWFSFPAAIVSRKQRL
jgi:hypothetical protein